MENVNLTGNPTTPTQTIGTNNRTIANTSFVHTALSPVIWAPGGGGTATTFEEAYNQLLSKPIPTTVYLARFSNTEPQLTITPGTWDLQEAIVTTLTYGNPTINNVIISDNTIIRNPGEVFRSCSITFESNSPVLEYDLLTNDSPPVIYLGLGSIAINNGTSPVYISEAGSVTVLANLGGTIVNGANSQPILELGAGAICILRLQNGAIIGTDTISGPIGSIIAVQHDGGTKFTTSGLTLTSFAGSLVNQPIGINGGSGPTSFRPDTSDPTNLPSVGCSYYDVTLGYVIYWTGAIWVDANGNPV